MLKTLASRGGTERWSGHRADVAEDAEIDVRIARPLDDVPASRAIQPNRGLREGSRIEPLLDQFLARPAAVEFRIADDIGAIVREPVEVSV